MHNILLGLAGAITAILVMGLVSVMVAAVMGREKLTAMLSKTRQSVSLTVEEDEAGARKTLLMTLTLLAILMVSVRPLFMLAKTPEATSFIAGFAFIEYAASAFLIVDSIRLLRFIRRFR